MNTRDVRIALRTKTTGSVVAGDLEIRELIAGNTEKSIFYKDTDENLFVFSPVDDNSTDTDRTWSASKIIDYVSGITGGESYLSDLLDTSISSPQINDYLIFDGTYWSNSTPSITDLLEIDLTGIGVGDLLQYDGAQFVPITEYTAGTGLSKDVSNVISLSHLGLQSLTDPNNDRILFWDDSESALKWLTVGSNLTITDSTISATDTNTTYTAGTGLDLSTTTFSLQHLGLESLTDPGADRILFWDDSETGLKWLTLGSNLSITDSTINVSSTFTSNLIVDIGGVDSTVSIGDTLRTNLRENSGNFNIDSCGSVFISLDSDNDETSRTLTVYNNGVSGVGTQILELTEGGNLSVIGQLISTVSTGTAPLSVTSTTVVPNLNVSQLLGGTWAIPGTIGSTTPNTGAFTTLSATGNTTIGAIAAEAKLFLVGAAGFVRDIIFYTGSTARWVIRTNSTAESGSSAGSDLEIIARDDAGANLGSIVTFTRASGGAITIARPVTISSTNVLTVGGNIAANSGAITSTQSTFNLCTSTVTTANLFSAATAINFGGTSGTYTFGNVSGSSLLRLNGAAGSFKALYFSTAGSIRWIFRANTAAEAGSDAGSDLELSAYSDAGSFLSSIIYIVRAAGGSMNLYRPVQFRDSNITSNQTTINLFTSTVTTANIFTASTTTSIGATTNSSTRITNIVTMPFVASARNYLKVGTTSNSLFLGSDTWSESSYIGFNLYFGAPGNNTSTATNWYYSGNSTYAGVLHFRGDTGTIVYRTVAESGGAAADTTIASWTDVLTITNAGNMTIKGTITAGSSALQITTSTGTVDITKFDTTSASQYDIIAYNGALWSRAAPAVGTIYLSAAGATPASSSGSNAPEEYTNSSRYFTVVPFLNGGGTAFWSFVLPDDFNSGFTDIVIYWMQQSAGTGTMTFDLDCITRADTETLSAGSATTKSMSDTASNTTNQLQSYSGGSYTISGAAAGELCTFKITRNASDTFGQTAYLLGILLKYNRKTY